MTTGDRKRSWWGWGWEDAALDHAALEGLAGMVAARFGGDPPTPRTPADVADLGLRAPRVAAPDVLAASASTDDRDRAAHAQGKSFRDIANAFAGVVPHPPDLVARPGDEAEVIAWLDWATDADVAVVPYGGGSSVVGGVTPDVGDRPVISLDLASLDAVTEVDTHSQAARVQGGVFGPSLEQQLRPQGLTLRHFPQSFEFSTLGGWIATRAGGHFATGPTHIDDLVESVRMVTPAGIWESRRLPASGAGPSPDRLALGSEGALGVITEAWVRVRPRPAYRAQSSVRFSDFSAAADAARTILQGGLLPSNCRLLDAGEAVQAGVEDGSTVLLVGFESPAHPVEEAMEAARVCCSDHGGVPDEVRRSGSEGTAGSWRSSFVSAPYWRDAMVALGCVAETFETAVTWDRLEELVEGVRTDVTAALADICGGGTVTCRFTHVYPDGAAPYFTVVAPGDPDALVAQWDQVKIAASEALERAGGTITHHHAVGRDHRPWYDRQRPEPFAAALTAAKGAVDPAGILNPGVLLEPVPYTGPARIA